MSISLNQKQPLLITGAAGFIGARVVEFYQKQKIPLVCVDELKLFGKSPEHRGLDFGQTWDIHEALSRLNEEKIQFQAVIHMGACSDTMQLDWEFLKRNNLEYSQSLWNYCAKNKVPLIYASSAATYGEGGLGYDDSDELTPRLAPLNPYGESKKQFDVWALEQEKLGKTPPHWSGYRFFNVYGFGEAHKGKMASVVYHGYQQILKTGRMKLFESHREGIDHGEQKRDFIYVNDVVEAMHFGLTHPIRRGIYNLGTGQARTFLDLAKATFKALGREEKIDFVPTPEVLRPRYQYFTQAEMQSLRKAGYSRPFTSLEDGVTDYVKRLSQLG